MNYSLSLLRSLIPYTIGISSFFTILGYAEDAESILPCANSGIPNFFLFTPIEDDKAPQNYPVDGDEETYQDVPPSSISEEDYPVNGEPAFISDKKNKKKKKKPCPGTCIKERPGFFLTADYLFWSFNQDQLVYAFVTQDPVTLGGITSTKTKAEEQDFDWHSGFRLGAGGRLPHDNWDLYLNWTYFNFNSAGSKVSRPDSVIPIGSIGGTSIPSTVASSAKSSWHVNFETLDLELGKVINISRFLVFRPFFGVQGAMINQTQNITYDDILTTALFAADHVKRKNDSLGIGPRMGINTTWLVGKGIGIVGNISGALLYSKFDAHSKFSNDLQTLKVKNDVHLLRPNLQLALGLDWAYCFANRHVLKVGANYEMQIWWSQWLSPTATSFSTNGDLGTQGISLEFRFDF